MLKAETVEVVHDFEEHLLFNCCSSSLPSSSSSCCPAITRKPTEQKEQKQKEQEEGVCSSLLHYITQGCCQNTNPSSEYSSSELKNITQAELIPFGSVCDLSDIGSEFHQISFEQKPDKKSTQIMDFISPCDCSAEPNDLRSDVKYSNIVEVEVGVEVEVDNTQCRLEDNNELHENENNTIHIKSDDSQKRSGSTLKLIVSHGDCVCVLPPESVLLGSSQTCTNEMYLTGKFRNIFACQSHPEFEYEYCIKDRIWPAVTKTRKRLNDEEIKSAAASFENFSKEDSKCLLKMIKSFLQLPCTLCTSCH